MAPIGGSNEQLLSVYYFVHMIIYPPRHRGFDIHMSHDCRTEIIKTLSNKKV